MMISAGKGSNRANQGHQTSKTKEYFLKLGLAFQPLLNIPVGRGSDSAGNSAGRL